ncbi:MAG TPA: hypothetical protein VN780_08510 [Candidatus Eisenbacteria bacterium]|jgi:hypothetical protein|nr:hypothetical protein [Candidatus Eisenbacteria bacterium]
MRLIPWAIPSVLLGLTLALLGPSSLPARAQFDAQNGPLPVFELHSGFWINLHHTLYLQARQSRDDRSAPSALVPGVETHRTANERQTWDAAVAYYQANYADKDLLFNTELTLLKNQLGEFEGCDELSGAKKKTCDAGLPPALTKILESAAVVYRAHEWPAHDRANRVWIAGVAPLVREKGLGLSERLAEVYQARWPKQKIRVDVTAYANWAGAYTTLDPLRVVIASTDPRNQGSAALEILFHEASHGIAEPVQLAINRECRQRDKAIPRDLWHALLFYTTGEVIKPVMAAQEAQAPRDGATSATIATGATGSEYMPYAFRERLYQRGWDNYLSLLRRFWQPYLDGKASFDDAIAHMVSAL